MAQSNVDQLVEYVSNIASKKHGKTVIFGSLVVVFSLFSFFIVKLGTSTTDNQNQAVASPEREDEPAADTTQKVTESEAVDEQDTGIEKYGEIDKDFKKSNDKKVCDNRFPLNGFRHVYRSDWETKQGKTTEFKITNKSGNPIWVNLNHPTANFPIVGFMVYPLESITKRVNIGLYTIDFSFGKNWCNVYTGMVMQNKKMSVSKKVGMTDKTSVHFFVTEDKSGKLDADLFYPPRQKADDEFSDLLIEKQPAK